MNSIRWLIEKFLASGRATQMFFIGLGAFIGIVAALLSNNPEPAPQGPSKFMVESCSWFIDAPNCRALDMGNIQCQTSPGKWRGIALFQCEATADIHARLKQKYDELLSKQAQTNRPDAAGQPRGIAALCEKLESLTDCDYTYRGRIICREPPNRVYIANPGQCEVLPELNARLISRLSQQPRTVDPMDEPRNIPDPHAPSSRGDGG